jgi:formylglycine-generating enzyme required for sulfatase activity
LPTEEEWEFAARGGDSTNLYPWGREWIEGHANVGSESPKPVGSYGAAASHTEALDMIGNVWEWTSSTASVYPGNTKLRIPPKDQGQIVVRGGSYQSKAHGEGAITATSRQWVPRSKKDPTLGFRLVRQG